MIHFLQKSLNLKLAKLSPIVSDNYLRDSKIGEYVFLTKEMACCVVMDWTTFALAHLLKWSTATITNFLNPVAFETGPRISSPH